MAMNRTVKRILVGAAVVPAVLVGGVLGFFYGVLPKSRPAPDVKITATPEMIAHGKYLANHVVGCLACHSKTDESIPGDPAVAGHEGEGRLFVMPGFPGEVRASNLTPDPGSGIGKLSDGQIVRAVRDGIGHDGRALFPMMPYATFGKLLPDEDLFAVIAYLRTLPAIKNDPGRTRIDFPVSMFIRAAPQPMPSAPPPAPKEGTPERGEWLLSVALCRDCHDTANERMEKKPGFELAGGTRFELPGGGSVHSANITSDPGTGLGAWSDEDVRRALLEGKTKSGRALRIMPFAWYRGMTPADLASLIGALRKVKAVSNIVPAPQLR